MVSPEEIIAELLSRKGWSELFPAQDRAVQEGLLRTSSNYVIIAPTASGKTGIAEMSMLQSLYEGRRIAYLVPLSSIINDKIQEFEHFTDEYSIYPSEDSDIEFSNADIVLMTFENFYRHSLLRPDIVSTFGLVVVDEFHVLYDKLRGFNLEKVLTVIKLLEIRIICLSATFENKELISNWLNATNIIIPNELRSVELTHGSIDLTQIPNRIKIDALYRELDSRSLFPAIIFCYRRQNTQSRAQRFSELRNGNVNSSTEIRAAFSDILGRSTLTEEENSLVNCLVKGVAFHHSGLRRELREYIENKFRDRDIMYLFATTGLAYGVNFPAKTVVLYDIDFYIPSIRRQEKIPVYIYLQMAGRAGRPQFDTEGHAYVVAKDRGQLERRIPEYLDGNIEEATSHIGIDDFFQKTILELIFAGQDQDDEILRFFNNTYYNFLSERIPRSLIPFDLFETVQRHAETLVKNGFMVSEGAAGYRLTDLGSVTIDFLFNSYIPYELKPFVLLDRYLDNVGRVMYDFDLLYKLYQFFSELRTSRKAHQRSNIVDSYFSSRGKSRKQIGNAEYSVYATYYGWMENLDEIQIEDRFNVHAHPLASNAREMSKLLTVYKTLAEKKLFDIPEFFNVFCDRIYYGVTEEELPFIRIRGIGRETTRSLKDYCKDVLSVNRGYRGTVLDILCQLHREVGEEEFKNVHVTYIEGVGPRRTEQILSVVKNQLGLIDEEM